MPLKQQFLQRQAEDLLRVISEKKPAEKGKEENTRGKRQVLLTGFGLFRKRINKEKPHHKQHQSRSQVKATLKVLSKIIRKHLDKWLFQTEIIQLCSPSLVKTSVIIPGLFLWGVYTFSCSVLLWVLVTFISKPSTYFTGVYSTPILVSVI